MPTTVVCSYTFEAAHFLPLVPQGHPCGRVHGHSYRAELHVTGSIDARRGWVVDFAQVDAVMAPVLRQLDHHLLNEVDGLANPTLELVAAWLYHVLVPGLPELSEVVVHESSRAWCRYAP